MMKLIQEKAGTALDHIDIGNNFMNSTAAVQLLRERIDKQAAVCQTKKLMHNKGNGLRLKRQVQNGRKSLPVIHLTRD
jgi:hypothetical protein